MPLIKVKIKYLGSAKRDEFSIMNDLCKVTPLNISDCFHGHDNIVICIHTYEEVEKLLLPESAEKLKEMKLKVIPPPCYKSENSVCT